MSRIVLSNIFSNISATLINILMPLVTIPILVAGLGVSEYGIYVTLIAKAAIVIVLSELGLGMYMAKEVSINRGDAEKVSSLLWVYIGIKVFFSFLVFFYIVLFLDDFDIVSQLLFIYVFFQLVNITPILNGLEDYSFITKVQLVTKSMMTILALIISFSTFGLEKALALQAFIASLTSIALIIYFLKNHKFNKITLSVSSVKVVLIGSLPFYGAKLFVNLYQQSSTYFVSLALATELVAIYSVAIQLYKVGQSLIGAVARVLYTSTVRTKDYFLIKKLTIASLFLHLTVFPLIYFYGDLLLGLIFSFDLAILFDLSILLYASLFSIVVSSYWGYPALSAIGKEKYAHIGIFVSSIAYFLAFGFLIMVGSQSIYLMVGCIVLADFVGMIVRLIFARNFKLL